jgi:hypothetical protein
LKYVYFLGLAGKIIRGMTTVGSLFSYFPPFFGWAASQDLEKTKSDTRTSMFLKKEKIL